MSDNHDFIMLYAKNKELWKPNLLPRTDEMNSRYKNPDNDPRGAWTSSDLSVKRVTQKDIYEITTPNGTKYFPTQGRSWEYQKKLLKYWLPKIEYGLAKKAEICQD